MIMWSDVLLINDHFNTNIDWHSIQKQKEKEKSDQKELPLKKNHKMMLLKSKP